MDKKKTRVGSCAFQSLTLMKVIKRDKFVDHQWKYTWSTIDRGSRLLELTVLSLDKSNLEKFFFHNAGHGKRRMIQLT